LTALLTATTGAAGPLLFAINIHGVVSLDLEASAKEPAISIVPGGKVARVVWSLARRPR